MTTTDSVLLLKNEHRALLGQLSILERMEGEREEIALGLKTLIRDCTVHFKRETLLFDELEPKLSPGGRSLRPLIQEHRELKKQASALLKDLVHKGKGSQTFNILKAKLEEFAKRFRSQIEHEEKVVFLLAGTRLTKNARQNIGEKMLVT